jgi:hypothetical protein
MKNMLLALALPLLGSLACGLSLSPTSAPAGTATSAAAPEIGRAHV